MCEKRGMTVIGTVVDHKIPHRGNEVLFWDQGNWQTLCKLCHDSAKQIKENSGILPGCDVNGMPLDEDHLWSKGK
jgi:hypothetical protein